MTAPPVRSRERFLRWRDGLLFLPWIGAIATSTAPAYSWGRLVGAMALSGTPIALYLMLEALTGREQSMRAFRRSPEAPSPSPGSEA